VGVALGRGARESVATVNKCLLMVEDAVCIGDESS
jgi:hypothetical protein